MEYALFTNVNKHEYLPLVLPLSPLYSPFSLSLSVCLSFFLFLTLYLCVSNATGKIVKSCITCHQPICATLRWFLTPQERLHTLTGYATQPQKTQSSTRISNDTDMNIAQFLFCTQCMLAQHPLLTLPLAKWLD